MTLKAAAKLSRKPNLSYSAARARATKARQGVGEQTGYSAATKSLSTWVNEPLALLFWQRRSPRLDCVGVLMQLNGNRAVRVWHPKVEAEYMGALPAFPV
jgi:hypothetical protein